MLETEAAPELESDLSAPVVPAASVSGFGSRPSFVVGDRMSDISTDECGSTATLIGQDSRPGNFSFSRAVM